MATAQTRDDLIEALAAIEHERRADWQRYLHERAEIYTKTCWLRAKGQLGIHANDLVIPADLVERWERQIATPYAELSGPEQGADIEQVMRYWPPIAAFVETWIERDGGFDDEAVARAARWWVVMMPVDAPTEPTP